MNNATLKALGLTKEQGKNAIEALKRAEGLPNNAHFKIMSDGKNITLPSPKDKIIERQHTFMKIRKTVYHNRMRD